MSNVPQAAIAACGFYQRETDQGDAMLNLSRLSQHQRDSFEREPNEHKTLTTRVQERLSFCTDDELQDTIEPNLEAITIAYVDQMKNDQIHRIETLLTRIAQS